MKIIPQNDYVLCKKIEDDCKRNNALFFYDKVEFPLYKIVSISKTGKLSYSVDDLIICNSIGTKVDIDGDNMYLFKNENIVGKVY